MSVSFSCHCPERKKPVAERNWIVWARNYSRSAFNGGRWKYSEYSQVQCLTCSATGRTKAKYVKLLRDFEPIDWQYVARKGQG